jgi:shikimate dehydrogenase
VSDAPLAARRAAVLGSPIKHSLSPVLHCAAYAALGLRGWRYDRYECDEKGLASFVDRLGAEWVGLSLTMPLKRVALDVADEVSPLAAAVGAANTLVFSAQGGVPRRRRAENTDVYGIVSALREAGLDSIERAVILGAGGTAQAALAALQEFGHTTPDVIVRDPARTSDLRAAADRLGASPTIIGGYPHIALPPADVIISTLPGGAADPLRDHPLPRGKAVLDVVYAPWPTPFAAAGMAAGCHVVSGLTVLLHQAVAQVELMTGRRGPVAAMRDALDAAVRARTG